MRNRIKIYGVFAAILIMGCKSSSQNFLGVDTPSTPPARETRDVSAGSSSNVGSLSQPIEKEGESLKEVKVKNSCI